MKTPMIDLVIAHPATFQHRTTYTGKALATELRAVLAERDRLAGEVTEWEGHAQTFEAGMVAAQRELAALKAPAPRRLREYKGVTYRDGRWHIAETPFDNAFTLMYWYAEFVDADHAALLALRDDPWMPVETLEAVLEAWANATRDGVHSVELSDLEHRLRAWLATQPQTITPEQAVKVLVENGARRSSAKHAAKDSYEYAPVLILPTATPERGT